MIFVGLMVAIPVTIAGYLWATKFASRYELLAESAVSYEELLEKFKNLPSATAAFTPLILPIILIALKSIANFPSLPFGSGTFEGRDRFYRRTDGRAALRPTVVLGSAGAQAQRRNALRLGRRRHRDSAAIIMITAAGGSLGALLAASKIADYLGSSLAVFDLGIFPAFLIAAALKTAQGSVHGGADHDLDDRLPAARVARFGHADGRRPGDHVSRLRRDGRLARQ